MCKNGKNCEFAEKCIFAHSFSELRKKPCRFGKECSSKEECEFSHEIFDFDKAVRSFTKDKRSFKKKTKSLSPSVEIQILSKKHTEKSPFKPKISIDIGNDINTFKPVSGEPMSPVKIQKKSMYDGVDRGTQTISGGLIFNDTSSQTYLDEKSPRTNSFENRSGRKTRSPSWPPTKSPDTQNHPDFLRMRSDPLPIGLSNFKTGNDRAFQPPISNPKNSKNNTKGNSHIVWPSSSNAETELGFSFIVDQMETNPGRVAEIMQFLHLYKERENELMPTSLSWADHDDWEHRPYDKCWNNFRPPTPDEKRDTKQFFNLNGKWDTIFKKMNNNSPQSVKTKN